MKKGLIFLAVLVIATSAQAVTHTLTNEFGGKLDVVITQSSVTSPLGTALDSYLIELNAPDPNDTVAAVDLSITPKTTSDDLYQIGWYYVPPPPTPPITTYTPDMLMAQYLNANSLPCDTHFLLNTLNDPLVTDPNDPNCGDWSGGNAQAIEDNDMSLGTNVHGEKEGYGTYLNVNAFVTKHAMRQNLDFAIVAMPTGDLAEMCGTCSNGAGDVWYFDGLTGPPGPAQHPPCIPIPEPATMGLLVLGGFVVLVRRRR